MPLYIFLLYFPFNILSDTFFGCPNPLINGAYPPEISLTVDTCIQKQKMQTCGKKITLNEGISTRNYVGCLAHYFMLSFVFVSVDSLQPLLFQKSFQIDRKEQIQNFRNALVITFDIIVKLFCAPVFGYLADRYGRKKINIYGIICISATMSLMPYAPSYWIYVILRCIYATGAIAISVVPLLADYVSHQSRGTSAAFLVLMSSFGALGSAYINFTLLTNISDQSRIYIQYGVISSLILLIGLFYTLVCLKPGNDYYARPQNQRKSVKQLYMIARQSLKSPQITNSYTAAFLARGDSILLSLYLVLWTYSFSDKDNRSDSVYEQAFRTSSMLSGIAYLVIMLTCIIYGFYYGRKDYSRSRVMIIMLTLAIIGSALINFAPEAKSFISFLSLIVLGLGMSGLLTASLYLVNQYSTAESRGFLTGIQTFFGVIGILCQTIFGAILFEYVNRTGPFNYFSITCIIVLIVTLLIYRKQKQQLVKNQIVEDIHGSMLSQNREQENTQEI